MGKGGLDHQFLQNEWFGGEICKGIMEVGPLNHSNI